MVIRKATSINDSGRLQIGGLDAVELAEKYGTPLFVMDENYIRESCRAYVRAMKECYGDGGIVIYAGKAMLCMEICGMMQSEGVNLDAVSGGEIYTALKSGFPGRMIHFHGSDKADWELSMAVDGEVGRIIVDNKEEIESLNRIAVDKEKIVDVLVRIKPGVEAHTHSSIKTGQVDSKFGFALETGEAIRAVKAICERKGLRFKGVHCHIGSQIFDARPFVEAASAATDFLGEIKRETGKSSFELNLGGGFGVSYVGDEKDIDYVDTIRSVSELIKEKEKALGITLERVYVEPGRSIVARSGVTLYKTGWVKEIPGVRTYVSVDGGMTDNPRYALYGSEYEAVNASKAGLAPDIKATIVGKCCESGDVIQKDVNIKSPERGDILAVLCTGAYNYSMSSNYNRTLKPAVVAVADGKSRLIVKRQTLDDVIAQDL